MLGNCEIDFSVLIEHARALPGRTWEELLEQSHGEGLHALVTADLTNSIFASMVDEAEKWTLDIEGPDDIHELLTLPPPLQLVGIYAIDNTVYHKLLDEAHIAEYGSEGDEFVAFALPVGLDQLEAFLHGGQLQSTQRARTVD